MVFVATLSRLLYVLQFSMVNLPLEWTRSGYDSPSDASGLESSTPQAKEFQLFPWLFHYFDHQRQIDETLSPLIIHSNLLFGWMHSHHGEWQISPKLCFLVWL
jgi:hypothetical protein